MHVSIAENEAEFIRLLLCTPDCATRKIGNDHQCTGRHDKYVNQEFIGPDGMPATNKHLVFRVYEFHEYQISYESGGT